MRKLGWILLALLVVPCASAWPIGDGTVLQDGAATFRVNTGSGIEATILTFQDDGSPNVDSNIITVTAPSSWNITQWNESIRISGIVTGSGTFHFQGPAGTYTITGITALSPVNVPGNGDYAAYPLSAGTYSITITALSSAGEIVANGLGTGVSLFLPMMFAALLLIGLGFVVMRARG